MVQEVKRQEAEDDESDANRWPDVVQTIFVTWALAWFIVNLCKVVFK